VQELSPAEREAVFAFLSLNVEEFEALAPYEIPLKVILPLTETESHLLARFKAGAIASSSASSCLLRGNTCHQS
jgi:hypothetical protein